MNLFAHKCIQSIAKQVHGKLHESINAGSTEETISRNAFDLLAEFGISETWYHGVPALVLAGSRSCLSISGRDYSPSDACVGETNLITVDLSPSLKGIWGDCARSYFVESGRCTEEPRRADFREGRLVEAELHRLMKEYTTPDTRLSELFDFGNRMIQQFGFENLDFLGNLGHSIETKPSLRRFIDRNCHESLGDVELFTFEPHIRKIGGSWGFKHENIYYFDRNGRVQEL